MRVLITAGATEVPIDRVRAITNIFKGKTGMEIARAFAVEGWRRYTTEREPDVSVTLLTSNPDRATRALEEANGENWVRFGPRLTVVPYRTFFELAVLMEREITSGGYDLVIHSAAVSDYSVRAIHAPGANGQLTPLAPLDATGKVRSDHHRLFLELERTPKLIEQIRSLWGFRGRIVQFKLEVGITDDELIARARASLARSRGDLCVANCLEWMRERAYFVSADGSVESVPRKELPTALVRRFT